MVKSYDKKLKRHNDAVLAVYNTGKEILSGSADQHVRSNPKLVLTRNFSLEISKENKPFYYSCY
jgi:hypothetical protein